MRGFAAAHESTWRLCLDTYVSPSDSLLLRQWNISVEKDARAVLETFNGLPEAPPNVETRENYWALIGKTGKIVDDNQSGEHHSRDGFARVLVEFDDDLDSLGLENHNPLKNSLWIRVTDLKASS